MTSDPLAELSQAGVSIWLDDLSRPLLASGRLADLTAHDHVVGVTTNPTIFAKAITGSDAYAAQLRDLAAPGRQRRPGASRADHVRRALGLRRARPVL